MYPKEQSTPTHLLVVERGSILSEGTISVWLPKVEQLPLVLWSKCTSIVSYFPNMCRCLGWSIRTYCFDNSSPNAKFQLWDTSAVRANGQIQLHSNLSLCLDGGSNPSDNGVVKLWTCGGYAQQQWLQFGNQGTVQTSNSTSSSFHSASPRGIARRLMIDQCLDIQLGSEPSSQPIYNNQGVLQTYTCYPGSQQQNFHTLN